jgi:IS1 family transposase
MKKCLCECDFLQLKNYVISVSVQPNVDRCSVLHHKDRYITFCMNEKTKSIFICEGVSNNDEKTFNELLELSKSYSVPEKLQGNIDFYNETIEPNTKCCELNR